MIAQELGDSFVGRESELEVMRAALTDAGDGRFALVSIEGDAGIGKTALLRQFVAELAGLPVLWASGDETETVLEHGVIGQLRATLQPSHDSAVGALSAGVHADSFAVGAEFLVDLGQLQDRGTVVVVVDDLQWSDPASVRAVLFALRRLRQDHVLVLVAGRSGASDAFGESWARLIAERARRLRLVGLEPAELRRLAQVSVSVDLSQGAGERLRDHTGGNPLYVRALLEELPVQALTNLDQPLPAPHSYAATVLTRVADLSPSTQDLLAAGAVIGVSFLLELAAEVAGTADTPGAFDEARAARLLIRTTHPATGDVAFPHPLVRAAVYDDLAPPRRRDLHKLVGQLLSGPAALAHRVIATQGRDAGLADAVAAVAAADVARGSLAGAAQHLLWAANLTPDVGRSEAHLLRAAELMMIAGDVPGAHQVGDAVVACADTPEKRYVLGALLAADGQMAEAAAEMRQVAETAMASGERELVGRSASSVALAYSMLGDGKEAVEWAERALDADADPAAASVAHQALASGLAMTARADEAVARLDELVVGGALPRTFFEAELMATRGNLHLKLGNVARAVTDLTVVVRWAREGAPLRSIDIAHSALAEAEYRAGAWDDALVHAELAVSLCHDLDHRWFLSWAHAVVASLHAGRGSWSMAGEHVDAARHEALAVGIPAAGAYAHLAEADLAWAQCNWDGVLRCWSMLQHGDSWRMLDGANGQLVRLWRAEALIATGRQAEAADVLAEVTVGLGDAFAADIHRIGALLAVAEGRDDDGAGRFAAGLEDGRTAGTPLGHALLEMAYGKFLRLSGQRRRAIPHLRTAQGILAALDAGAFVAACDAELVTCGVRGPAGPTEENPHGLTSKEQVVAHLVVKGLSNREVASELYVSTKAVEYHLGNIFAKLAIGSRRDLAVTLGRPRA